MSGIQVVSPVYQQALYYPYVRFRDPHWLKVTALYWDGILRMVPPFMEQEDLERRDDPLVQELKQGDPNFIRSVYLAQDNSSMWASQRLVDMIKDAEAHPDSQSLYQTAMHPHTSDELTYPIALSAGLDDFYRQFVDRHLARYDNDKMMFYFEPTLGQIFMALLATHVASKYGVSVISHEAVYHDLLRAEFLLGKVPIPELPSSAQLSSEVLHGPVQERLVTMAFEAAVPDPEHLDDISIDKILTFRRDHADDRRAFFNFIRKMADDLSHAIDVTDSNVLQDRLRVYEPQFKEATQKLRDHLKATGIDAILQTLSIDGKIPLLSFLTSSGVTTLDAVGLVTAPPLVPVLTAVTAVGSLAVGLFQVSVNWRRMRTTEREKSPYSYLLDLNEFTQPQSLLQRQVARLTKFIRGS
jgi:hypothetical protein